MPLLFVAVPKVAEPTQGRRRAGWWAVLLGLIVLGHGCHSGDHEIDNEPGATVPRSAEHKSEATAGRGD